MGGEQIGPSIHAVDSSCEGSEADKAPGTAGCFNFPRF